jgi:hypothetical protein
VRPPPRSRRRSGMRGSSPRCRLPARRAAWPRRPRGSVSGYTGPSLRSAPVPRRAGD